MRQSLAELEDRFPDVVEEVRGQGLLTGIKLKPPVGDVIAACFDEQLLTVIAGDNVVRLIPPLNVSDDELGEAVKRLSNAFQRIGSQKAA